MVTITLEENEIDIILNLVNRKIEKINDKLMIRKLTKIRFKQKKEFEDLKNHILVQIS